MRRLVPTIVLALAGLLVLASLLAAIGTARFAAGAETAAGRVVDVDVRSNGGAASERAYFPVVEFRPTTSAAPVRFSATGSGAREYRIGDEVDVLFRTDEPTDARLKGAIALWSTPALYAFGAVLMLGTGALLRRILLDPIPGGPDPDDVD